MRERRGQIMQQHTLCANRCCCRLTAVAAPCRALDNGLEYDEGDDTSEARVLDVRALCMFVEEAMYLREREGRCAVVQTIERKRQTSNVKTRAHGNFEILIQ